MTIHERRTPSVAGITMAIALLATLVAGGVAAEARPRNSCGTAYVRAHVHTQCSFVANGSHVVVQASGVEPFVVTYSLLTPVFPGFTSVDVKVTDPQGKILARCKRAFLEAVACLDESTAKVPKGTRLTCFFSGAADSGGEEAFEYLCSNRKRN
jgi:hypothetical protein